MAYFVQLIGNLALKSTPEQRKTPEFQQRWVYYVSRANRLKRIATTYLVERFRRLVYLWWITSVNVPEDLKANMSSHELYALGEYDSLVNSYLRQTRLPIRSMLTPPRVVLIEVEVLEDCGDIATEHGYVRLTKGSRLLLKRTDCEDLLKRGDLREIC